MKLSFIMDCLRSNTYSLSAIASIGLWLFDYDWLIVVHFLSVNRLEIIMASLDIPGSTFQEITANYITVIQRMITGIEELLSDFKAFVDTGVKAGRRKRKVRIDILPAEPEEE